MLFHYKSFIYDIILKSYNPICYINHSPIFIYVLFILILEGGKKKEAKNEKLRKRNKRRKKNQIRTYISLFVLSFMSFQ